MTTCALCHQAVDSKNPYKHPMTPCTGSFGDEGVRCILTGECNLRAELREVRAAVLAVREEMLLVTLRAVSSDELVKWADQLRGAVGA